MRYLGWEYENENFPIQNHDNIIYYIILYIYIYIYYIILYYIIYYTHILLSQNVKKSLFYKNIIGIQNKVKQVKMLFLFFIKNISKTKMIPISIWRLSSLSSWYIFPLAFILLFSLIILNRLCFFRLSSLNKCIFLTEKQI